MSGYRENGSIIAVLSTLSHVSKCMKMYCPLEQSLLRVLERQLPTILPHRRRTTRQEIR